MIVQNALIAGSIEKGLSLQSELLKYRICRLVCVITERTTELLGPVIRGHDVQNIVCVPVCALVDDHLLKSWSHRDGHLYVSRTFPILGRSTRASIPPVYAVR